MKPALAAAGAIALVAVLASTHAQQQVVGGRALDNSLQRGVSGFNAARTPPPGLRAPAYNINRYRGTRNTTSYRARPNSFTVQTGGRTETATYGLGGYSTLGNELTAPAYNPLASGARVQRAAPTTPRSPNYASVRRPATTTYRRPTPSAYPNASTTVISTAPVATTNPGLAGLARPTYTTVR